jgi:pyrimidine-specific ribonucleoside hydrolase
MPLKGNYLLDLETSDPDDIFALALLATHPRSNLVAVTIHPGGKDQVGLVKHVLNLLGRGSIPVGVGNPKSEKTRVSGFHTAWLGEVQPQDPDGSAVDVILSAIASYPDTHLVTGAALTNIFRSAQEAQARGVPFFREWTCQGGFAGDNIVPPNLRLPKFEGRVTCPTFNLGGDWKAAVHLLCQDRLPIPSVTLVSKNVCHGMFYSPEVDSRIPQGSHPGLDFIKAGMKHYFKKHPDGKALHDVVAAVIALNPSLGTWSAVYPYRDHNGEWGCHAYEDRIHIDRGEPEPPLILTSIDKVGFERCLSV